MNHQCSWCAGPLPPPAAVGRPRRYCSVRCRIDAGHYREDLPAWTARLAELEAAEASFARARMPVSVDVRNELDWLRAAIAAGPVSPVESADAGAAVTVGDGPPRADRPPHGSQP